MSSNSEKAVQIKTALISLGHSLAVCETSAGGLLHGELLAVPGASAYCHGGAVAYSESSRRALLGIPSEAARDQGVVSEAFALLLARTIRERLGTVWGLAESGIAGPQTNRRSRKPAGLVCVAISGSDIELSRTLTLPDSGREANMRRFAGAALDLLLEALDQYRR